STPSSLVPANNPFPVPVELLTLIAGGFTARQFAPVLQVSRNWNHVFGAIIESLAEQAQRILHIEFRFPSVQSFRVHNREVYAMVEVTTVDFAAQWADLAE